MIGNLVVFIFGSVVGSFLNVCIVRMPIGESVVWPRSYCPKCRNKIAGYDNIPIISYILLGAKCRSCRQKISLRYLVVELLTPVAFLVLYSVYGLSYDFFFYMALTCGLIVATFVDIRHRIIPDEISVGGMILGFILNSVRGFNLQPFSFSFKPMLNSFWGIIIGGGIIYITGFLFDLVYFKILKRPPIDGETESMGGGDVKLLAMIGAYLGWQRAVLTFFIAPLFGAVIGIINLITKKEHTIPYGPFLALGAAVSLFWADKIISLLFYR